MENPFGSLQSVKKTGKRKQAVQEDATGAPDFNTIKKFNSLKIAAPTQEEDY